MATYSHNADDLTVLMTANNAPSPNVVSASEEDTPDYLAFKAFDHSNAAGSFWQTNASATGWLKFDFGSGNAETVAEYTVSTEDNPFFDSTVYPKTWTFQGSNNDSDWTTLDTQTDVAAWSSNEMRTYAISSPASYRYYRINVTTNQGGGTLAIAELEMLPSPPPFVEGTVTDDAGMSDTYEAFSLTDEVTNNVGISDVYTAVVLSGKITNNAGMSDAYVFDTPYRDATGSVGMSALFECGIYFAEIVEGMGTADISEYIKERYAAITDGAGINDENALTWHFLRSIQNNIGSADDFEVIRVRNKTVTDTLSSWDTLKWGWNKTIADSLAIVDTASKILGIPVKEWLTLTDTETNNWSGTESLSDSFYAVDISKVIQVYEDLLADGMAITDAARIALELIITDILICTDTVINTGTFQHLIEDGMTLEDVAKRFFPKSISDSFAATDTNLVDFLALLQISDSFNAADTASRLLTINQTIADSLEALDTVTVQQLIYELIQEGLNFDVSVIVDGEVWECWVLNTSRFHPSVYSNYEFNSFAIDRSNNICYGCKSDGIYTLEGSTDNGTTIRAGIILPKTDFGLMNNKRMRKAWLAVDDDNLILKLETESGYRTFRMTDAECSLTRDLKGRRWEISVEGFESMDSLNLVPVILSRK